MREMAGAIIFCKTCKVPLSGKDQFLGHQILSHELGVEDAETAWQRAQEVHAIWRDGGMAA